MGIIIGNFQGLIRKAGEGAKSLLLTSPNGSESWISGSSHDITWEASQIAELDLYYSIDNGSNWLLIEEKVDAGLGSYSWTIPVAISSTCLVKIIEYGGETEDSSDAVFTIDIGWLVATYVNNSGSPLAWHDAEGGIAAGKVDLIYGTYHTLGNDSHGSNNADIMDNCFGQKVLKILAADAGVFNTLGTNNAFTYIEKVKYPSGASGYTRYAASSKGWIIPHVHTSKITLYLYIDGGLQNLQTTTQTYAADTWYYILIDYISGTAHVKVYDAAGNLLEGKAFTVLGTYQTPSSDWSFETNGANNHYCSHFGYINKVASDTDIANFISWGNTY